MHNNYYFLKQLTPALSHELVGKRLIACFSQNKNELILTFANDSSTFIIKAHLSRNFCCLSFPESFHRARKNSVDLFKEIVDHQVSGIYQFENERAFQINFDSGRALLFKMHGNRSNILLVEMGEVKSLFNGSLKNDWYLDPSNLDRPIDQSFEAFKSIQDIGILFPTLNREMKAELNADIEPISPPEGKWELIQNYLKVLENGQYYYDKERFSLTPIAGNRSTSPIRAISDFFVQYVSHHHLHSLKKQILGQLTGAIKKTESYIKKAQGKLKSIELNNNYRIYGDLIMANLHMIEAGAKEAVVNNFYDNNTKLNIPLKATLSPQKNAEFYYKKSKNQSIELSRIKENIELKKNELSHLKQQLDEVETFSDYRELKNYSEDQRLTRLSVKSDVVKPYHQLDIDGFQIWLGKHAKANDDMLKKAYKDDLWLHAKDVAGSHVLIKYQAGKAFPNQVKEKAAQLAAYHSKRKTESLCPVIITPKKYVRKRKGDPPGAVIVERENVILVAPKNIR